MLDQSQLEQLADLVADRLAERLSKAVVEQAGKKYISREDYASSKGIGVRTVDRLIAEGKLKVERVGRRILIPAS